MNPFKNLKHRSSDELRSLAGLCAGAAFLLVVAIILSGSLPLPGPARLAVNNIRQAAATANAAAVATYNSGGTYTWTVPANVNQVTVTMVGGGGGGQRGWWSDQAAVNYCNGDARAGGGGGSGGVSQQTISVTPGQQYTVVVGGGGAGGYYSNPQQCGGGGGVDVPPDIQPTAGGSSSFGATTATGGAGANKANGGAGGSPGGVSGTSGSTYCTAIGAGGTNGTGYGSGGNGYCGGNSTNAGALPGGPGQSGAVIINYDPCPYATAPQPWSANSFLIYPSSSYKVIAQGQNICITNYSSHYILIPAATNAELQSFLNATAGLSVGYTTY